MGEPGNHLDEATESENKTVALLIAVLALFLALSEAGAKKSEHHSTEKNIESSDLYNFYQARKVRMTIFETSEKAFDALAPTITDEKAKESLEKQAAAWKAAAARFDNDPKKPEDDWPRRRRRQRVAGPRQRVNARKGVALAHVARRHDAYAEVARRADGDQRDGQRLAGRLLGDARRERRREAKRRPERSGEFADVAGDGGELQPPGGLRIELRRSSGLAAEVDALRGEQDRKSL